MTSGVGAPRRARISARTLRTDRWWLPPLLTNLGLLTFVVYAGARSFMGKWYWVEEYGYLTPFYSPCLSESCLPGSSHFGTPLPELPGWIPLGFVALPFLLGFRLTCYYYRKAYYRAWFWDPPACAAPDLGLPGRVHGRYVGETRFPWVLLNSHRFFLYGAVLVLGVLWYDTVRAFVFDGHLGIGIGSLLFLANVILLSLYTASCHSLRHLVGGGTDCMSCSRPRDTAWRWLSALNPRHGQFAWYSLVSVVAVDAYIRLLNAGVLADPRLF